VKKKSSQNRRDFLKTGLAGMAGMTVLSGTPLQAKEKSSPKNKLIYRKLGKTGIKLPIISIGTGDTSDSGLIKAALDAEVKLLATSKYYGNGQNESMVGQVIKQRKRESVIVATSAMPENFDHKNGVFNEGAKADLFVESLEGSLKRLGVEYVDIFLLPFMAKRESVFYEPYLKAMENIKKQGKARFIGIATHSHEDEAVRAAVEAKIYDVCMVAYNFRKENRAEIGEALAYAAKKGMGIIAMKTMAGAYWDKDRKEPINSTAALKWALQNENVHTAIPGVTTFEQLENDIAIMSSLPLKDEEKKDLKLSLGEKPEAPFCQQCGACLPQCNKSLDIPTLMRSHMYAYGYGNMAHARVTLASATQDADPCAGCDACPVSCTMNFDVKSKITGIARLNRVPEEFII
jgi:predicted aldo/keto reductase-like oxidoreductase